MTNRHDITDVNLDNIDWDESAAHGRVIYWFLPRIKALCWVVGQFGICPP